MAYFGLKTGKGLKKRAAHPYHKLRGLRPGSTTHVAHASGNRLQKYKSEDRYNYISFLTLSLPRVLSSKLSKKSWISFCKIVKNKRHHMKVLLNSFHLRGHTHYRVSSIDAKGTTTFIDSRSVDSGSERVKLRRVSSVPVCKSTETMAVILGRFILRTKTLTVR